MVFMGRCGLGLCPTFFWDRIAVNEETERLFATAMRSSGFTILKPTSIRLIPFVCLSSGDVKVDPSSNSYMQDHL